MPEVVDKQMREGNVREWCETAVYENIRGAVHYSKLPVDRFTFSEEIAELFDSANLLNRSEHDVVTFRESLDKELSRVRLKLNSEKRYKRFIHECLRKKGIVPKSSLALQLQRFQEHMEAEFRWNSLHKEKDLHYLRYNPERGFLWKRKKQQGKCRRNGTQQRLTVKEDLREEKNISVKREKKKNMRQCRQCESTCIAPRRSFCSAACLHLYKIRSSASYIRKCLLIRDGGICDACGLHTEKLRAAVNRLICESRTSHRGDSLKTVLKMLQKALPGGLRLEHLNKKGKISRGHFWNADHILAVSQGGGNAALEGFRTLCVGCHRKMTGQLRQPFIEPKKEIEEGRKTAEQTNTFFKNENFLNEKQHCLTAECSPSNLDSGIILTSLYQRLKIRMREKKELLENAALRENLCRELFRKSP